MSQYNKLSPETLANALQDTVHKKSVSSRPGHSVKVCPCGGVVDADGDTTTCRSCRRQTRGGEVVNPGLTRRPAGATIKR